jgi:hypothetical protein
MENNNNLRYKPDRLVNDFEADLEKIRSLFLHAANSRDFWSGADKVVFTDDYTRLTQRFLSYGTSLHGLRHRLVLDEEDETEERYYA